VLSQREWQEVNPGDFIILDRCSYDPVSQKGTLTLACRERPLFKVKIKKNNLKILDYAFYQGEQNNMDEEFKKESEGENEFAEDLDLEEEPPYVESEEDFAEESEHLWEPGQEQRPAPDTLFSAQEIPLNIVVEVDRIRMNLHKLLQLQPGNILELSARPEQGVSLTVNGKKIARAELIKLGDILGVKILEIGDKSSS
jgi:flagellar motor switch protein FliN